MRRWSEEWLRGVADWRAVKQGREWFEAGSVAALQVSDDACKGRVGQGRSARRVLVRVNGPHDVEARCGCPANAADGAVCGHAAAVVIAACSKRVEPKPEPAKPAPAATPVPATAVSVELTPQWLDDLIHERLCARLVTRPKAEAGPSDARLATKWLRGATGGEGVLSLRGAQVGDFLADLAGHAQVSSKAKGAERIEVLPIGVRLPARIDADPAAKTASIQLRPSDPGDRVFVIGGIPWQWLPRENRLCSPGTGVTNWDRETWVELIAGRGLECPIEEISPRLAELRDVFAVDRASWLDQVRSTPAQARIVLELEGSRRSLDARLSVHYPDCGDHSWPLPGDAAHSGEPLQWDESHTRLWCRDPVAEQGAVRRLVDAGFSPLNEAGAFRLDGEDPIAEFVAELLPDCRNEWELREGERWQRVTKDFRVIQPSIEALESSREGSVEFQLRYESSDGKQISTADIRRLLGGKRAAIQQRDGRTLILPRRRLNQLQHTLEALDIERDGDFCRADDTFEPWILELRENLGKQLNRNSSASQPKAAPPVSNERLNQMLAASAVTLRDYQCEGIAWLLERVGRWGSALLADDMGLGKTLQVLVLLQVLREQGMSGPTLVVCPTSVIGHWREQAQRFWKNCRISVLHGQGRDSHFAELESADLAVTSYATLDRDRALHLARSYGAVVLDEASVIRNPDTDAARSVCKLQAGCRLALTGTPIENGVRDLWSIFRFLRPGYLGTRQQFKQRYEDELKPGTHAPGVLTELRQRVAPLLLRRTKERVATELPPRIQVDEWCVLGADQRRLYESILHEHQQRLASIRRSEAAERMELLTVILRLRQVCCDPGLLDQAEEGGRKFANLGSSKVERCVQLVGEALSENRKVLVFSQFAKMLGRLREVFTRDLGIECALLTGSTTDRDAEIARFRKADGPGVFLISLKAGGYGLNLTEADVVIHFDPWWNPAAEAQATDRTHRIGQTRPVNVYRLLTSDTVEARVLRHQANKRELVGATIEEHGIGPARGLNTGELEELLS